MSPDELDDEMLDEIDDELALSSFVHEGLDDEDPRDLWSMRYGREVIDDSAEVDESPHIQA